MIRLLKIYRRCPEIRSQLIHLLVVRIARIFTIVILSPITLTGFSLIMIGRGIEFMADTVMWPVLYMFDFIYDAEQLSRHKISLNLSPEEIKKRLSDEQ